MSDIGATIGGRLTQAMLIVAAARGQKVTQAEVGEWVGEELGREPYYNATVSAWQLNETEPTVSQVRAFCTAVLRRHGLWIDPGWLAFGAASQAPSPHGRLPVMPINPATIATAVEAAAPRNNNRRPRGAAKKTTKRGAGKRR